jgi:uncharacterized membrane protein YkvI
MKAHDQRQSRARWRLGAAVAAAVATGILLAQDVLAAPAKPATTLVNVADTRVMAPGLGRWIADVYNLNLWWFGALVVVTMVSMGLVLGLVTDRLVGLLGINLGRIRHHE